VLTTEFLQRGCLQAARGHIEIVPFGPRVKITASPWCNVPWNCRYPGITYIVSSLFGYFTNVYQMMTLRSVKSNTTRQLWMLKTVRTVRKWAWRVLWYYSSTFFFLEELRNKTLKIVITAGPRPEFVPTTFRIQIIGQLQPTMNMSRQKSLVRRLCNNAV
jgi:hypothetical protein